MTERELHDALWSAPLDDAQASEERAWRVVRAAQASRVQAAQAGRLRARRPRRRARAGVVAVCALGLAALVLAAASRPREALAHWIGQAIGVVVTGPPAPQTLAGLPGGGALVIDSSSGAWIVDRDRGRHRLGSYVAAQLSPHGRFVLAWRGSELQALTPRGEPQWAVAAPAPVKLARWSTDGYRVAYVTGSSLRVVAGDGSGDRDLVDAVASVAPAWQPNAGAASDHRIAVLDARGYLQLRDADSGALVWRHRPTVAPSQLLWAPGGRILASVASGQLTLYGRRGRVLASWAPPAGQALGAAAFAPAGDRLAIVVRHRAPFAASVETLLATPAGLHRAPELLLSVPEQISGLAWSPDGRWLLAPSPSADQWTLIHAREPISLRSISHVSSRFVASAGRAGSPSAFPTLAGWQP